MKNPYNHTFFLILAVLVLIFVGGIFTYVYRMIDVSLTAEAVSLNKVSAASASKSREQAFLQLYESTSAKWARLPQFFVPADKVVSFIEALEAIGPQSGSKVTLSAIDADNLDSAAPGTQGSVRVQVESIGSWSAVMRALALAEVMSYKTAVRNVSLTTTAIAPASGTDAKVDKAPQRAWRLTFGIEGTMLTI